MRVKIIGILWGYIFLIASCHSDTLRSKEEDSSKMMDSGIFNNPDTLNSGPDTSVIDTPDTGKRIRR